MTEQNYIVEYKNTHVTYTECLTLEAKLRTECETHSHHDDIEIYKFIEGDLFFAFEGERIDINPGDIVIITSGTLHRPIIKNQCRYFRKRILISNNFFANLPDGAFEIQYILSQRKILKLNATIQAENGLDKLFDSIEENLKKSTPYSEFCATIALCFLLIRSENLSGDCNVSRIHSSRSKVRFLIEYIDKNISSELNYKTISQMLHISEKNLYKLFKNETGFSLSKYIKERRIIKAKSLLNAGVDPSEVAVRVGFSDYSVFYRSFLSVVGTSPSNYMKKIKFPQKN